MNDSVDPIPEAENRHLWRMLVVMACLLLIFVLLMSVHDRIAAWAEDSVTDRRFREAKEIAAEQIEAAPIPHPVRTSLAQCISGRTDAPDHEIHWMSLRESDASVSADMAEVIVEECAEEFVLAGGALDEMIQRATVLEPVLPDAFADGALAQALEQAK